MALQKVTTRKAALKKMASMKGKRATNPQASDVATLERLNNNNSQSNRGAIALTMLEPSQQEIRQFVALAITPRSTQQAQHDQGQSLFFKLPPELRPMVFDLVFSTGSVDSNDNRVILVEERRKLRTRREHDYKVVDFKSKQLSLARTCRQIKDEIHHYFWEHTSFKFASTNALSSFIGCYAKDEGDIRLSLLNLPILRKAKKVEAVVKKEVGWIDGLVAVYTVGKLLDCVVEPVLVQDTPATRDTLIQLESARRVMADLKNSDEVDDEGRQAATDTAGSTSELGDLRG